MNLLADALAADGLRETHPAWRLLRSAQAATTLVILRRHLGGDQRRQGAEVLFERVEADLERLREHFDLPLAARAYCARWREEGFLVRRAAKDGGGETYELSDAAWAAIAFTDNLAQHRQAVTGSRLATIVERIHELALTTDPDRETRLRALQDRREQLDEEIERVRSGQFDVLDAARAAEGVRDVLALLAELPGDFAHVRNQMEQIDRALRRQLIEDVDSRGTVLDEVFSGIDRVRDSDAGRSFDGFYSLLFEAELQERLDADIEALTSREWAGALAADENRSLTRLLPGLQEPSQEIHHAMTALSRSLRRFVQSQDYKESSQVHALLLEAAKAAAAASPKVHLHDPTAFHLALPAVRLRSVSALRPHNPADSRVAEPPAPPEGAPPVDLAYLREAARASEIDMAELTASVRAVVAGRGAATIGEVLAEYPASQGVASVIGLMVLAERLGSEVEGSEEVAWDSVEGVPRRGAIPIRLFKEVPP
ncbi:MAG: DUF3375 domain-containing protein [Bifidobacteriaceae bacterium]|nr:DUF3375 domain-containing protein [Bifidobacteriaceae bacterium]